MNLLCGLRDGKRSFIRLFIKNPLRALYQKSAEGSLPTPRGLFT